MWATSESSSNDIKYLFDFVKKVPNSFIESKDLMDYIKNKDNNKLDNKFNKNNPLIRSLSALLTFPLTLSYGLKHIYNINNDKNKDNNNYDNEKHPLEDIKIVIIGARAESSLPIIWWRESMYLFDEPFKTTNIHMLGPGLQFNNSLKSKNKENKWIKNEKSSIVDIINNKNEKNKIVNDMKLLHEHPDHYELLKWAGIFVVIIVTFYY